MTSSSMLPVAAVILALVLLTAVSLQAQPGTENLRDYLTEIMSRYEVPAIAAASTDSDSILAVAAVGLRRLGASDSVSLQDRFHIGSCTKSMTSLLLLRLEQEGRIDLDTPVVDFYPELSDSIEPSYAQATVRHLLNHKAGLPAFKRGPQDFEKVPEFDGAPAVQRRAFIRWLLTNPPEFPRGEFNYSNVGYVIANDILSQVISAPIEDVYAELLFEPRKLTTAGFGDPAEVRPNQPWGHWQRWLNRTPTEPVEPGAYPPPDYVMSTDNVHMSILDFARYAKMHLRGKVEQTDSGVFRRIHQAATGYSYGWFVHYVGGNPVSYHWGSNGKFTAVMAVSPEQNLACVVMVNSSTDSAKQAVQEVLDHLLGTED